MMELQAELSCRIEPAPGASARRTTTHHRKRVLDLGSCLNSQQWWVGWLPLRCLDFQADLLRRRALAGFTTRIESNRDGFRAVEGHLAGRCQYRRGLRERTGGAASMCS